MTIPNNRTLREHADHKTGKRYVSATDTSGKHTLTVDTENAHLLKNTAWWVSPMRKGSTQLVARACSNAPACKKGSLLHRKVFKRLARDRRVRAFNANLLDARKSNLQTVSRSDIVRFNTARPAGKLIGVEYAVGPKWLKTECFWHVRLTIKGKSRRIGSFRSREEAACAHDAASCRLYGPNAVTNRSLNLISENVARTKVCRRAAKLARRKVAKIQDEAATARREAFDANPTRENFVAWGSVREREVQTKG
jgi:hypothetical protein